MFRAYSCSCGKNLHHPSSEALFFEEADLDPKPSQVEPCVGNQFGGRRNRGSLYPKVLAAKYKTLKGTFAGIPIDDLEPGVSLLVGVVV